MWFAAKDGHERKAMTKVRQIERERIKQALAKATPGGQKPPQAAHQPPPPTTRQTPPPCDST